MTTSRQTFLQRIRDAVEQGNRAGTVPPLPTRDSVGYQGGGPDLVARFCEMLTAAGGEPYPVSDRKAACEKILELVKSANAHRVLLSHGKVVDSLELPSALRRLGCEVVEVRSLDEARAFESFFAADLGITGVDYLIAETGSIITKSSPASPRSASLLPPLHIAVAEREQVLPDLFDLFDRDLAARIDNLPACVSVITGPSKTGDIELKLVTGVHGPGEVHVVIINA